MGIVAARLKSCPSQDHRVGGTLIRERSCGTQGHSTALRSGRNDRVIWCAGGLVEGLASHPSAQNALEWGTLGLVWERKSSAEILRWESPVLPETPLPQDDGGVGARGLSKPTACPSSDDRETQGPSTAFRSGRNDRGLASHPSAQNAIEWGTLGLV